MKFISVLDEVNQERERQDTLWGVQSHNPERWYAILGEEVGEVGKAICNMVFEGRSLEHVGNYREELIQVAAVAVAMVESLDRDRFGDGKP